jgi:hypothetical protein
MQSLNPVDSNFNWISSIYLVILKCVINLFMIYMELW